ncbi:MAG: hypothetical protein OEM38_05730 [Gammaproteobacteria bacterium]|nr:hypothetical protein [Gammaproteobacteria bacterium]
MRHYEIAANGTVPCFYQYKYKPKDCAPHGLVDMKNMLTFDSAEELSAKIEKVEQDRSYNFLRENILAWVKDSSCRNAAERLMRDLGL